MGVYGSGCVIAPGVIICTGRGFAWRSVRYCPTCHRRRRFVMREEIWYGFGCTCVGCGDSWQDAELLPRPFRRGWRREAITKAKSAWMAAGTRRECEQWIRAQVGIDEESVS